MAEVDVPSWLKSLALAPEYHPTEAEFLDPINYIFKIEQEASQYGICKIVPPYSKAPKRVVFHNLNLSLANSQDVAIAGEVPTVGRSMCPARNMGGGSVPTVEEGCGAKFTTRRQQLGWNARKVRGGAPQSAVHKSVWQSGETYTLEQFEAKAKIFARNRLGTSQEPLAVETHFWKAATEKAITIEYANDIPGSAFAEPRETTLPSKRRGGSAEGTPTDSFGANSSEREEEDNVGFVKDAGISGAAAEVSKVSGLNETADNVMGMSCKLSSSAWNMRKVARSPGSLLRFIPDEVPGVTSPMVYIGMLFSWFAWHVEDHELHSLNYLHTGAPKTWYAVPGDAASALEEVVRIQGYGNQLNARDAFARLGEKTTVMSPEVLVAAGVPCCRLVQNAGEYVVTFPRAYHLGFSHGFNCGEAANFATPGWLEVAREASVRRAAMNYLPMLSHQQLLYTLAMSFTSRFNCEIASEKPSSRVKEDKSVGEEVIKSKFVNDVIHQNDLIGKLLDNGATSCLLVRDSKYHAPHASTSIPECIDPFRADKLHEKMQEEVFSKGDALESLVSETPTDIQVLPSPALASMVGEVSSVKHKDNAEPSVLNDNNCTVGKEQVCGDDVTTSALSRDLSMLPCAACGILCFSGIAIVQLSQSAATSITRLYSYTSGSGSRRIKGVVNLSSGVLPGRADKKSADFHMLPNVEAQPLPELEGTIPDVFVDSEHKDHTEEPEIWTPDLKECPTTYKDSSNDVALDEETPQSYQASADFERKECVSSQAVNAASCVGNIGLSFNSSAEDNLEVDKQDRDSVSGLGSGVSADLIAQALHVGGTKYCSKHSVPKPAVEGALSSLQLLAAAYDDDSDIDECDQIEHCDEAKVVVSPLPETKIHTADISGVYSENPLLRPAPVIGCPSNLISPSRNSEIKPISSTSEDLKSISRPSVIMLSPSGSQTLFVKETPSCFDELSEEHSKSGVELENHKQSCSPFEDSAKTLSGLSNLQSNRKSEHEETLNRDEAKHKSPLSFGECVTCSLPHDSFFDSFEEAALKSTENDTMELENSSQKINPLVSSHRNSKVCTLVAPELDLEPNEPVEIPCNVIVKADSQLEEASSVSTDSSSKLGESLDNNGSLAIALAIQDSNVNGTGEIGRLEHSAQIESNASSQLQILMGAARPRMLCLEHAVATQKMLESIGGGSVIIVCNSNFSKVEQQAKVVAAEIGAQHQWRTVQFKEAGYEEHKVIAAALEEHFNPGDNDWVNQLGLSAYGQSSFLSNDIDVTDGNPFSEVSEELGSRTCHHGRKEEKSLIVRQWCGKGWRADQLHPLLGGRLSIPWQVDNTSASVSLPVSGGVSSLGENGRSRKVMRPARLAEYTTDGRAPKGESGTKKSYNKRRILLEMSEDELVEQNSQATPSRLGGSGDSLFPQATPRDSSGDSLWREVPIVSTDSFLLSLQLPDAEMAAERGCDDFLFFSPHFRSSKELRLACSQVNTSLNNASAQNVASQSCAVVGGFLQRGAKLQALQKLCNQLSTNEVISVPCTPLTTPSRFASWMKAKSNPHKRISTAKLVNRLKRKSTTDELSWDVKKQKSEVMNKHNSMLPALRRENSSGHHDNGEGFAGNLLISKKHVMSVSGKEVKEDLSVDHGATNGGDRGLRIDMINNYSETSAGDDERKHKSEEELMEEQYDSDLQPVQDCNNRFLENSTNSNPIKSILQRCLDYGVEGSPQELSRYPPDKIFLQTPNIHGPNPVSITTYCTESLPQGPGELNIQRDLGLPSIKEVSLLVPRRVRAKRTKSRSWKSCIQITPASYSPQQDNLVSSTCEDGNPTSEDGSNDPAGVDPKLTAEGCDCGGQADPDYFSYLGCLTCSTANVRRRRMCTPDMKSEWGVDTSNGNEGEAEGGANQLSAQQSAKAVKKRKNGNKKPPATKRCESDLEGEFQCDVEGCIMAFDSINDLELHRRNRCTWKGCGKHFHMHKYLLQHRRVHLDDRPLKCPWKGCTQAFKWAWARTEHIRVHTGERPYKCMVSGCGQTFRFVSDFSRHKRNTGHRTT
ncbi:uncharacterized protein [Physcomitrium patens]|uniref:uncharacterized protein isoform X4 n=1 Tax=Physcomitrium patens TaxID=3218 RepID=UPI000D15D160|nr:uncharacterized protein LOC112288597 isoform X4 [Physcomitrium patens]|eukprot:XP_024388701.1 uncharacterized protein LOC112288597 isoform X4 [Physcomitrella patens]